MFAFIRKRNACFGESFAYFRDCVELNRESSASIYKSFAFIRKRFALIRKSYALIRESFFFREIITYYFTYENELNELP